jgi:hypothetical protein
MLGMFVLGCVTLWAGWLMFIAEYWVRRLVLPDMQHAHILDAIRAFRDNAVRLANRQSQP